MSAMSTDLTGLPHGRPLQRADLDTMPDDGHRYELLDGMLIVSPAPRIVHQRALFTLSRIVADASPDRLDVLFAPVDVVLADDTVLQPDLVVAATEDFTDRDLPVAPVLAVEVLSPSTRSYDLLLKKERLQRSGCAHYWVVDPDEPSITAWTLEHGRYVQTARAAGDDLFTVTAPFPVELTPGTATQRDSVTIAMAQSPSWLRVTWTVTSSKYVATSPCRRIRGRPQASRTTSTWPWTCSSRGGA